MYLYLFVRANPFVNNENTTVVSFDEGDQTRGWKMKESVLLYIREYHILHIQFAHYIPDGLPFQEVAECVSPFLVLFVFGAIAMEAE